MTAATARRRRAARLMAALFVAMSLFAGANVALAQTPGSTPPSPPAEVINCARPGADRIIPDLVAPEGFAVTLDEGSGKARLSVPDFPADATCYLIYRGPVALIQIASEWDASGIPSPGEIVDEAGFDSAGRYCYTLIIGSPAGRSEAVERCVDVPTSVAPLPTPTPTMGATPPPPGTNFGEPDVTPTPVTTAPDAPDTGTGDGQIASSSGIAWWLGGGVMGLAALALAVQRLVRGRQLR